MREKANKKAAQKETPTLLEFLNNCIITCTHNEVFKAKQIVFLENLVEDKAEENDAQDPVDNHDLQ